jgi:molybdate transport system ATP-binding protein
MIKISLHKHLGDLSLQLDLELEKGSFLSLYGPSGAGKTSILRMIAGFMKPDGGFIHVNGDRWFDREISISPQRRGVGFVFQDYALFPNMNVEENIKFALQKGDKSNIVPSLLDITGLTKLAARKIHTLSGGQQQRVALARAIAQRPALLLLDEPLSAIDSSMRVQLQDTLQEVHERFELTTILVSHDVDEIVKLSDVLVHIENGVAQVHSSPADFFIQQQGLFGSIVAVDNDFATVLLDTRFIRIPMEGMLKKGEKVEIVFRDNVPGIRK